MEDQVVEHPDVWSFSKQKQEWVICKVLTDDIDEGVMTIIDDSNKHITIKKSEICVVDPTHLEDLSDLSAMNNLHEAPLINVLRKRWLQNKIYTAASDVLISVNPYKVIPGLYDSPSAYFNFPRLNNLLDEDEYQERIVNLTPHVYLIANQALRSLVSPSTNSGSFVNQSVIISGESGAGKTEASKHVVNFLIHANKLFVKTNHNPMSSSFRITSADSSFVLDKIGIKDLILESSVIFEAFGNAKTVRNDNSSRFGKYIKLQYSPNYELISAATETFLLEKSRLVHIGENERNYHVFYQLLRGLKELNSDLYKELELNDISHFKILTMGNCINANEQVDDAVEFKALYQALDSLGVSEDLLAGLWMVLSCVLHLGNVTVNEPSGDQHFCTISMSTLSMEKLADMLGVNAELLTKALVSSTFRSGLRSSIHVKTLSTMDSLNNVNAVMKWLYFQVFTWLVNSINQAHSRLSHSDEDELSTRFIGILDIFGFEILTVNSFEQLCINYTNERLQQQFNEYVFLSEQELYSREGLDWTSISYKDNQNILDLIAKKPGGLLLILEEHGMMNRAPDDAALLQSFNHHDKHEAYVKSKFAGEGFSIKHFAGIVQYKITGFLNKNNNSLQEDLNNLLTDSVNPMLHQVIAATNLLNSQGSSEKQSQKRTENVRKISSATTVSLQFRGQLDTLIKTLRETRPHYIKCIKPNENKKSGEFNWSMVAAQLRYSGVLEVVRIRREGYPIRLSFQEFYNKYYLTTTVLFQRLYPQWSKNVSECSEEFLRECANIILKKCLNSEHFQLGQTMVFLGENGFVEMQKGIRKILATFIVTIQAWSRGYKTRNQFLMLRRHIITMQRYIRGFIMRYKFRLFKRAVKVIQRGHRYRLWRRLTMKEYLVYWKIEEEKRRRNRSQAIISATFRMFSQRKRYLDQIRKCIQIQARARGMSGRRRLRIHRNAGVIIQLGISKRYRGRGIRNVFIRIRSQAIVIQSYIRMFLAKRLLIRLKREYLEKCSLKIQLFASSNFHRKKDRSSYLKAYQSVILIQSIIRLFLGKCRANRLRILRRLAAGNMIQLFLSSKFLSYKAKEAYALTRQRIILLQTQIRRYHAMNLLKKLRFEYRHQKGTFIQLLLSSLYRRNIIKKWFLQTKKRIITIQSLVRRQKAKKVVFALQLLRRQNAGSVIQLFSSSHFRGRKCRKTYKRTVEKIILIQSLLRTKIAKSLLLNLKRRYYACTLIQSLFRMRIAVNEYRRARKRVIHVQAFWRKMYWLLHFKKCKLACIKVQKMYRGYRARLTVGIMVNLIISIQKYTRAHICMKRYRQKRLSYNLIQRVVRGYLGRRRANKRLSQLILIQSFARMAIALRIYNKLVFFVLMLQAFIRRANATNRYRRARANIIRIQSAFRRYLAMVSYQRSVAMIIRIQSIARMWNQYRAYQTALYHIITIQTNVRRTLCTIQFKRKKSAAILIQSIMRKCCSRKIYIETVRKIILVQSLVRKFIQNKTYSRILRHVTLIQSMVRQFISRQSFLKHVYACIKIQAFVRKVFTRHYFLYAKNCATTITKHIRGFLAKRVLKFLILLRDKARCLQNYFRSLTRNLKLYHFVSLLHACLRDSFPLPTVILFDPVVINYYRVRNKWRNYESVFHAACQSDKKNNLIALNPSAYDMLEIDQIGCTPLHVAMRRIVDMEVIYEIFNILDKYKYSRITDETEAVVFAEDGDSDDDQEDDEKTRGRSNTAVSPTSNPVKRSSVIMSNIADVVAKSPTSNSKNDIETVDGYTIIRQGFLKKKSEGFGFWQKRWFVLTDTTFQYYGSSSKPKNLSKPRMKILLNGCQISRYIPSGKSSQPMIEINLPNFTEKRNFFGKIIQKKSLLFQANDEKDLQEWLCPIKAVSGLTSFRDTAVKFVELDFHDLYVNILNSYGETPLHVLLKSFYRTLQGSKNASQDSKVVYTFKKKVFILASWLIDKGTDLDKKDHDNCSVFDLCVQYNIKELVHYIERIRPYLSLRNSFIRLRGYSYLNIFFGDMVMITSNQNAIGNYSSCLQPRLRVSVFNTKRQAVEDVVEVGLPMIQESSYFWWGTTWHMKTPLENIESNCIIVAEFYEQPGILSAWSRWAFNTETIDSDIAQMPLRKAPVTWDSLGSTPANHPHVIGTLHTRIMISRKIKSYTIEDVINQQIQEQKREELSSKDDMDTQIAKPTTSYSQQGTKKTAQRTATEKFGLKQVPLSSKDYKASLSAADSAIVRLTADLRARRESNRQSQNSGSATSSKQGSNRGPDGEGLIRRTSVIVTKKELLSSKSKSNESRPPKELVSNPAPKPQVIKRYV